ncbi:hypothetical protein M885DRAFT_567976 [Pelagophyceae sp. CCMP2097]|nr:hypothetical protein M885DRAFT_567976 [Pelagophyceae sp. CCMP2097]
MCDPAPCRTRAFDDSALFDGFRIAAEPPGPGSPAANVVSVLQADDEQELPSTSWLREAARARAGAAANAAASKAQCAKHRAEAAADARDAAERIAALDAAATAALNAEATEAAFDAAA